MAELINLRAVRKAKTKAETRAQADANAAKFGRSKAEKAVTLKVKIISEADLLNLIENPPQPEA